MNRQEVIKKAAEIASQAKWDGDTVIEILLEALTECNWHTEREIIEDALEGVE